ncbi:MAG: type II toxin-antitoxin system RelE/ParE family toxin [Hyphomicrobium sp.]|uniref:type II toxin-antitoxin system RelE/ParE family toxin n=1 Tax=Hyphomicrobium sp. TaxID=82 RepID=UPI00132B3D3D|nr:type II toxin-antitoxin system RelE/ParE family toxin [Hyphomicrobium sp.]KAB2943617.1 MAG: type II toxin-antitoxin system RelE/ParE family toxin [Hyphomicrobium sp.]MBZ0208920.1 type II toxin-antitoxin system RelE/ParE family toxin [Hyphomicrobium sp.]
MTLRYSARARTQIDYIFGWLSERNVGAAHDVVSAIAGVLKAVSKWPEMGKATEEGDVRVVIVPRYLFRIFYRVEGDTIFVIRVLHPRQER